MGSLKSAALFLLLALSVVATGCSGETLNKGGESVDQGNTDLPPPRILATLPVTENEIGIANLNVSESLPLGPAGFFSVADGYVIPDNVNRTVHILNKDLTHRRSIDTSKFAQGVTGAVQDGSDIVLLDSSSAIPAIVRLKADDTISRIEIPNKEASRPSGLVRDDKGLIVEYAGGERLYRITGELNCGECTPVDAYEWNGIHYSIDAPKDAFGKERIIRINGKTATISVPNMLGSARILGVDSTGDSFVIVEDVAFTPEVLVEQTIWRIDLDGKIIEVARVPVEKTEVPDSFGVAIGHSGKLVAMTASSEALKFWSLSTTSPDAILKRLPVNRDVSNTESSVSQTSQGLYAGSCLTSSQMLSNVNEYGRVRHYLSSSNIYNSSWCGGREIPSYLGSPGYYSSVSYDWGGFDTPAQFSSAMSNGYKAGNMNTAYILGCSYGVDCSGFVSRVWGFSYKLSTSTIPYHSSAVYGPAYAFGEALNRPGSHVVIFAGHANNGIFAYEATALANLDRVVYTYRSWSTLSGYTGRRSDTMC